MPRPVSRFYLCSPLIAGLCSSWVALCDLWVRPQRLTRRRTAQPPSEQALRWDPGQWVCSDGRHDTNQTIGSPGEISEFLPCPSESDPVTTARISTKPNGKCRSATETFGRWGPARTGRSGKGQGRGCGWLWITGVCVCVWGRTKSATGQMGPHTPPNKRQKWARCCEHAASLPDMMEAAAPTPWLQPCSPALRLLENGTFFGETQGGGFGAGRGNAHTHVCGEAALKSSFRRSFGSRSF